jgi:hypothetical protein
MRDETNTPDPESREQDFMNMNVMYRYDSALNRMVGEDGSIVRYWAHDYLSAESWKLLDETMAMPDSNPLKETVLRMIEERREASMAAHRNCRY